MTSTFLDYQRLTQNLGRSLTQAASRPEVAREREYYEANIGNVTSVEEFLEDRRLFAYAMKAYGLEEMTYAKAFMRKVLESDLNNSRSFVRQLVDTRYQTFASAFSFSTDGTARPNLPFVQDDFQKDGTTGLYSEHRVRQGTTAAAEAQYYQGRMATITSVDAFLGDERLFSYALTAAGLDPRIASTSAIRNVLTSDLSDPSSFANTIADDRYRALASLFSFQTDGSVASGGTAASTAQVNETVYNYYESSGNGSSPAAAAFNTDHYSANIGSVTSVDQLLDDTRLIRYALTAFGLDPDVQSRATIRQVLTSDLSDPSSFANTLADGRYRVFADAFNFATDGSVTGGAAQSADQVQSTAELFLETYDDEAVSAEAVATSFYRNRINLLTSVDQLIDNPSLYNYALEAYGLDPSVKSKAKIRQVLTSDLSSPTSFANLQSDTRYRELAAAFNFGANGAVLQPRRAQLDLEELATIRLYNTRIGSTEAERASAAEESTYYHTTTIKLQSLDALLDDDRLVAYLRKAYDLEDRSISEGMLRTALTSDPMDEDSFVNRQSDMRLRDLAIAFNFASDGSIGRVERRSGADQKQHPEDHRSQHAPDDGDGRRPEQRGRAPGALLPAQGTGHQLGLRHPGRQGRVRGGAHRPLAAPRHVAGRHRGAGRNAHRAHRPGGLPRSCQARQVHHPVRRALRPEQWRQQCGFCRVHHPRRAVVRRHRHEHLAADANAAPVARNIELPHSDTYQTTASDLMAI